MLSALKAACVSQSGGRFDTMVLRFVYHLRLCKLVLFEALDSHSLHDHSPSCIELVRSD